MPRLIPRLPIDVDEFFDDPLQEVTEVVSDLWRAILREETYQPVGGLGPEFDDPAWAGPTPTVPGEKRKKKRHTVLIDYRTNQLLKKLKRRTGMTRGAIVRNSLHNHPSIKKMLKEACR